MIQWKSNDTLSEAIMNNNRKTFPGINMPQISSPAPPLRKSQPLFPPRALTGAAPPAASQRRAGADPAH